MPLHDSGSWEVGRRRGDRMAEHRIRRVEPKDLDVVVSMTEERRDRYEEYQPVFWRKAEDSVRHARGYLASQIEEASAHFMVAEMEGEVLGFLLAKQMAAPPVYDPGGPTYQIDDFCVLSPGHWDTAGRALLRDVRRVLRERGVAQIVVVCGHADTEKARLLSEEQLSIASNWWTQPLRAEGAAS